MASLVPSLEPQNLTLLDVGATPPPLRYNVFPGEDWGLSGPSSSPSTFPAFLTSQMPEDGYMEDVDCGKNIRDMNFTAFEYRYRTATWIPFTWREVLKVVAYVVLFLVSLAGNLLVILVVCYNTNMRSSTNTYLVNLAAADLMVTLVCMWVHIVRHLSHPNYVLPAFVCKLDGFVQATALLASVLTLTVISVGRFVAVMFPLHARTSPNHAHRVIAAVWVVSALISCPTLFYRELYSIEWSNFTSWACEEFWPTESKYHRENGACMVVYDAKKMFYTVLTIALYFLPVAIMIVNYSLVVWTLWITQLPGEQSAPSRNTASRAKKRVVKMVTVVLLVFVLCWTPLQTLILYANFFHAQHLQNLPEWFSTMEFLAYFLAYSNSALNPIIYCGFNASFRQGLVSFLTCRHASTDRTHYRNRWTGWTGGTRETTMGCSGPEPAVLLELGSLKIKGRLGVRGGGGASQRGRYVFSNRDARHSSTRAPGDLIQDTPCKSCLRADQHHHHHQPSDATTGLTINPIGLMHQRGSANRYLEQNGGKVNIHVSHDSGGRKLSTHSSCSSNNGGGGSGCGCYQGKKKKKRKDLPLYHENQMYDELRENMTNKTKEEMV